MDNEKGIDSLNEKFNVRKSLIESMKEVKLMEKGILPKKSGRELLKELRED